MRGSNSVARLGALALVLLTAAPAAAQTSGAEADAAAVRTVVTRGYVEGIHKNMGRDRIREGFHPSFVMQVLTPDGVTSTTIDEWVSRMPPEGRAPTAEITHEIPTVTVAGDAAVAQVELYRDGVHVFTDFINLYRFPEGWRMVAKTFHRHPTQ